MAHCKLLCAYTRYDRVFWALGNLLNTERSQRASQHWPQEGERKAFHPTRSGTICCSTASVRCPARRILVNARSDVTTQVKWRCLLYFRWRKLGGMRGEQRRDAYPCLKARKERCLRNTEIRAMQRKQGWKLDGSGFRKKKKHKKTAETIIYALSSLSAQKRGKNSWES